MVLQKLRRLLPHACIVSAGMLLVFFYIDRVNAHQSFMSNEFHKWATMFLAVLSIIQSVLMCADARRADRLQEKKKAAARRQAAGTKTGAVK